MQSIFLLLIMEIVSLGWGPYPTRSPKQITESTLSESCLLYTSDCYLEFNEKETSKRIVINNEGYLSKNKIDCLENTNKINLSKELFKDDALVFNDLKSNKITIKSSNNDKYLEVDFTGFPDMGIWAPKDGAPFVCIEPWFGHADYDDFNGEFTEKEGVMPLNIGEKFTCTFSVTVK